MPDAGTLGMCRLFMGLATSGGELELEPILTTDTEGSWKLCNY